MNIDEIIALRKAFNSVKERQKKNAPHDLEEKMKRLRAVRESSVGNGELLKKAIKKLEENGIKVIEAKDKADAVDIILGEIGNERLVVKSKSNVTKGIELTAELQSRGIEVIETDIGDRILQVLKSKPSHPTGPVAYLSAKKIAKGLSQLYGQDISEEPEDIVRFIRDEIKGYIEKAQVGITGANAVTAEKEKKKGTGYFFHACDSFFGLPFLFIVDSNPNSLYIFICHVTSPSVNDYPPVS